jgi:hypothetical protein
VNVAQNYGQLFTSIFAVYFSNQNDRLFLIQQKCILLLENFKSIAPHL